MYFTLKALARTLILPPAGPLMVALAGLWLMRGDRRLGLILISSAIVFLWICGTPLFADWITRRAEGYPALDPSQPVQAQAIVIIGGGEERNPAPEYGGSVADDVLLERLAYGAFLAKRTSLPVLISGAPREIMAMNITLARNFGVNVRWIEDQSSDTFENARFSGRILRRAQVRRIVLVTSSTHMWRAAHEFMEVGFEVVPAPVGILTGRELNAFSFVPSAHALSRTNAAIYELLGEPMRRLQSALHIRERFDKQAALP